MYDVPSRPIYPSAVLLLRERWNKMAADSTMPKIKSVESMLLAAEKIPFGTTDEEIRNMPPLAMRILPGAGRNIDNTPYDGSMRWRSAFAVLYLYPRTSLCRVCVLKPQANVAAVRHRSIVWPARVPTRLHSQTAR